MAQQFVVQITTAIMGVEEIAIVIFGHCINSQVTAHQIVFKTHTCGGMKSKPGISVTGFAFGACQGVLFTGIRFDKYRKIVADRNITELYHLFRRCADHQPIDLHHWGN